MLLHAMNPTPFNVKFLRNRLTSLFRSEIAEMRAKMMKGEEAYTQYTSTSPESFAADASSCCRVQISEIAAEYGLLRRFLN